MEHPIIGRTHNARENLAFNVRTHNNWQANTVVTAIFLPFLVGKEQGEVTQHPMGETEKMVKKKLQPNIYLGRANKRANKVHAGLIGDA